MNQDIDCPQQLTLEQAVIRVEQLAAKLQAKIETLDLQTSCDEVLGRKLADDLFAPRAVPGFRNAAMDGYAFRFDDLLHTSTNPDHERTSKIVPSKGRIQLRLAGRVQTGSVASRELGPSECFAITTGAALPDSADTVIMLENTRCVDDMIEIVELPNRFANVRGADEDYALGQAVAACGSVVTPSLVGAMHGFGLRFIEVASKPRVIIVNTGNELLSINQAWQAGKIYDSNGPLLEATLIRLGALVVRRVRVIDDLNAIQLAVEKASQEADLVLITGGASAGEHDHTIRVLSNLGELLFWKVRMRPGMPVACAKIGAAVVYALPGNPVSVFATVVALVEPVLRQLLGQQAVLFPSAFAILTSDLRKSHDRFEFRRGFAVINAQAQLEVRPHTGVSSAVLRSLVESNVLIELPAKEMEFSRGSLVKVRWINRL